MTSGRLIWKFQDRFKKALVGNWMFERTAYFLGNNLLPVFLKKNGEGYCLEFEEVEISMSRPIHFSEFLIEKPLPGYLSKVDLEQKERVIDAGAYPGEFAIYAARRGAEVIALEPDSENAEELRENLELNGVEDRVKVIEKGLWSESVQKNMKRDPKFGLGSQIESKGEKEVDLEKLDVIAEEHGPVGFVKMDIEGAEVKALKGAENLMENQMPEYAIATYHQNGGNEKTCHEVEDILKEHGYQVETGYEKHLTTYGMNT